LRTVKTDTDSRSATSRVVQSFFGTLALSRTPLVIGETRLPCGDPPRE
jgi:hypothetical protein